MLKHIVVWTFKEQAADAERSANLAEAKAAIESLRGIVPGLLYLEAGIDIGAARDPWDLAVYAEFQDRAALDAYQTHPEHVKVAHMVGEMRELRAAIDYEV